MNGRTASTDRQPNSVQRRAIEASVANFEADADVVLQGWQVIDGSEFHDGEPAPADRLYVEFRYLDPHLADDLQHRPGREVHVYATDGEVLDCHDFG